MAAKTGMMTPERTPTPAPACRRKILYRNWGQSNIFKIGESIQKITHIDLYKAGFSILAGHYLRLAEFPQRLAFFAGIKTLCHSTLAGLWSWHDIEKAAHASWGIISSDLQGAGEYPVFLEKNLFGDIRRHVDLDSQGCSCSECPFILVAILCHN